MRPAWFLPCLFLVPAATGSTGPGVAGQGAPLFRLEAEKPGFLLGEPVYLKIHSTTTGKPPALEEVVFTLVLTGPDGRDSAYEPPLRLRAGPTPENPLPGAPSPRWARLIATAAGGLVFPRAGAYGLELRKAPADSQAISNRLAITVREPATRSDRRAYAIISRNPAEYALAVYLEGGDQLREGMTIVRDLAAFPSAYRSVARFVLCSDWSQDFRDYAAGKTRPADLAKALEYAQWKPRDAYVALRSAYRIAQLLKATAPKAAPGSAGGDTPLIPGRREAVERLRAFLDSLPPAALSAYQSF